MVYQPSTWPDPPREFDESLHAALRKIVDESVVGEIQNVINDSMASNGSLESRGHVIAIALMCAVEATALYGYEGEAMEEFIKNHFPVAYRPHAAEIVLLYRNMMVHSWNLFDAALYPGNETVARTNGTLSFGLLNFFQALREAVDDFFVQLRDNRRLQWHALNRYRRLKRRTRP